MGRGNLFRRRSRSQQPGPEDPFLPEPVPVEADDPATYRTQGILPADQTERIERVEPNEGGLGAPEEVPFVVRRSGRSLLRGALAPIPMFAIAFLFLAGAVAAVGFAQFTASGVAPWLSIGYSAAAVVCTVAALVLARRR